jgi:beta-glucuronidase
VTEFGARSIAGLRGDAPYTEEHHAAWLEAAWQALTAAPGVAGGIIWCWADYWHQWRFVGHNSPTAQGPFGAVTVDRQDKPLVLAALARMFGGAV